MDKIKEGRGDSIKKRVVYLMSVIVLVLSVWYHVPQKYERSYEVSTLQEESASFKVNINHTRTFFTRDKIFGQIEFNGKLYKSIKVSSNDNLFKRIRKKINGEYEYPWFIEEGFHGSAMDAEKIIIIRENNLFKEISFLHVGFKSSSMNHYYGPAETSKEAAAIAKKHEN